MAETKLDQLKRVLDELFMFDRADLDFGLYRIMNIRREEIRTFLDRDLLPTVRDALGALQAGARVAAEAALREAEEQARALGMQPGDAPKVQELRARLAEAPDMAAPEAEVYSHLASFFRRYYREGDFISLRRYKEGVYAIPYEGEEVKLHWANADQYYIKSTEQFRDYTFLFPDERRIHFKLVEADTERNDNRAQTGQERRFILVSDQPVAEQGSELLIRFEYRPDEEGRKQKDLNDDAVTQVLDDPAAGGWKAELARDVSGAGAKEPISLLAKHLNTYTAKNTYDYFIHKDLGGFLRRELDFYLKNEVMHLDDIDTDGATTASVEGYLRTLRAIRRVGLPIIDFLASLEEFQKRLWLKKKFVVETHWCVTLDQVPHELYPEIVANEAQREEWVRLFAIDEIKGDMVTPAFSTPLTEAFLEANPFLVLNSSLFEASFTERLLAALDDLDALTDGVLVSGDNFHALGLLMARFRGEIQTVYIDPPYNSPSTEILYKNDYLHSSWLTLLADRLAMSAELTSEMARHLIAIDENEGDRLGILLRQIFTGFDITAVSIVHNPRGIQGSNFKYSHECCYFVIPSGEKVVRPGRVPEDEWEYTPLRNWGGESERRYGSPATFYPFLVKGDLIVGVGESAREDWHPGAMIRPVSDGVVEVWPVDSKDVERKWRYSRANVLDMRKDEPTRLRVVEVDSEPQIQIAKVTDDRKTVWAGPQYDAGTHGTRLLTAMLGAPVPFSFPKSVHQVRECIDSVTDDNVTVLDYFAGSGTTAHAVINLNREDGGQRKYILVEMGEYFDTVMKPRVLKAVYSKDWKGGKPVSREGISQLIKVIRLESYEDTLNNLRVRRTERQARLLDINDELREQYTLRYWLSEETKGSASLLNIDGFEDPWSYTLEVGQGSAAETRPVTVDLVETFNYLLGLRVRHVDMIRGVTLVQGTLPPSPGRPSGEKALVIWRNTREMNAEALDDFLWSQRINPRDMEFDLIYVNGDNHLENSRRPDETWKVRLIENEFQRLMFETAEQERT